MAKIDIPADVARQLLGKMATRDDFYLAQNAIANGAAAMDIDELYFAKLLAALAVADSPSIRNFCEAVTGAHEFKELMERGLEILAALDHHKN
jgi:hypothetical protein